MTLRQLTSKIACTRCVRVCARARACVCGRAPRWLLFQIYISSSHSYQFLMGLKAELKTSILHPRFLLLLQSLLSVIATTQCCDTFRDTCKTVLISALANLKGGGVTLIQIFAPPSLLSPLSLPPFSPSLSLPCLSQSLSFWLCVPAWCCMNGGAPFSVDPVSGCQGVSLVLMGSSLVSDSPSPVPCPKPPTPDTLTHTHTHTANTAIIPNGLVTAGRG